MRFGEELLASTLNLALVPTAVLPYNTLKALLNDIVAAKLSRLADSTASGNPVSVPSHADLPPFKTFSALLDAAIANINGYYSRRLALYSIDLVANTQKLEISPSSSPAASSTNTNNYDDSHSQITSHLLNLHKDLLLLHEYAQINLKGIHKLIKKHDKVTAGNPLLAEVYKVKLEGLELANSNKLNALIAEIIVRRCIYSRVEGLKIQPTEVTPKLPPPRPLPFDLDSRYQAFLIDMDGVIYHGNKLLPSVKIFVSWLQENSKKFLFLTNSSDKTPAMLQSKLERMGIKVNQEHFYTSALSTAQFLHTQKPNGSAFVIGEGGLVVAMKGIGYTLITDGDEIPDYVVVGETTEYSYALIEKAINYVRAGARLIGTNLDTVDKVETGYAPSVGSLIAPITTATGTAAYFLGKPNPLMMSSGINLLSATRKTTLMIGDRMDTDIIGGLEAGIDTMLLLSGVTNLEDLKTSAYQPTHVLRGIDELVQLLFANTPSRKELILLLGGHTGSDESLFVEGETPSSRDDAS